MYSDVVRSEIYKYGRISVCVTHFYISLIYSHDTQNLGVKKSGTQVCNVYSNSVYVLPYVDKISRGFNFADDESFQFRVDLISRLRPS